MVDKKINCLQLGSDRKLCPLGADDVGIQGSVKRQKLMVENADKKERLTPKELQAMFETGR
ncbi:hypothetical protein [Bartonella sp. AP58NXGY]|uniref:hypothetical protein n=1 Tax=Bartonella sp. AP58NXGY TaxID=3243498 RepID=UPI0035D0D89F